MFFVKTVPKDKRKVSELSKLRHCRCPCIARVRFEEFEQCEWFSQEEDPDLPMWQKRLNIVKSGESGETDEIFDNLIDKVVWRVQIGTIWSRGYWDR